jgi:predicted outer membrane repeat protein
LVARRTFRPTLEALEHRSVPSTLTVTNLGDGSAGSLRAEIKAAHSGDTIAFDPKLFNQGPQTLMLTKGELLINTNLTITGPGAGELTISGKGASRVFEVAKPAGRVNLNLQVTLSALTVTDGFGGRPGSGTAGDGGGILNEGTLTVRNCTVSANSAGFGGAGIFNYYGTLTVSNCTLAGNTASDATGGGLGGGVYNWHGMLTLNNCIVSGNSAGDSGGGIVNDGGTVAISGGSLSGNSAGQGGGIYNVGTMTISDGCTLSGNSARNNGGAIFTNTSHLTIDNCNLSGNSAGDYGGGICNDGLNGPNSNTVTVSGCIITGNSAGQGGGICNLTGLADALTVSNSAFGNTQANTPDDIFGPWGDGGGNSFYP